MHNLCRPAVTAMDKEIGIYFLTSCLAMFYSIPFSSGSVTVDVGLLKYKYLATQRCDNVMLFRRCDPFFKVCFETPPDNRCDWIKTTSVDEKDELTDILHNHRILPNPISGTLEAWPGNLNVRIQIWDANLFSADKVIDETNWTYSGTTNIHLAEVSLVGNRQKASVKVSINISCDENYYGPSCDTYCQTTAYKLCSENGTVTCVPGFTGANCSTPAKTTTVLVTKTTNCSMETATERLTTAQVPSAIHSEIQTKRLEISKQPTDITTMIFQNQLTTIASTGTILNSSSQETRDYTLSFERNASLMPLVGANEYNTSTTLPILDISKTSYSRKQFKTGKTSMILNVTRGLPTRTSNMSTSSFSSVKKLRYNSNWPNSRHLQNISYPVRTTTPFQFTPVIAKIMQMVRSSKKNEKIIDVSTHTALFNSSSSTPAVNSKKDVIPDITDNAYSTSTLVSGSLTSSNFTSSFTSMFTSQYSRNLTLPKLSSHSHTEGPLITKTNIAILHNTTNKTSLTVVTNKSVDIGVSEIHEGSLPISFTYTKSTLQPSRPAYETTKQRSVFKTSQISQSVLSRSSQADSVQSSINPPTRNHSPKPLSTHISKTKMGKPSTYRKTYSTTKPNFSLSTHETVDYTKPVKADISVSRTSFTMTRRDIEQPTTATHVTIPSMKLNTPTKLPSTQTSSEAGRDGNLGVSSSSSEKNIKQTRSFLWGIGVSIFILFVVCIGSLVLWKLKRRERQKPPEIELIHGIKTDDTTDYKEGQLHLHPNKLEVIPECVDNPALDINETDT